MTNPPPGTPNPGSPTAHMPVPPPPGPGQPPQAGHPYPGPPPGYQQPPPGQFGPGGPTPVRQPMPRLHVAVLALAGVSVLGVVLGLSLKENGANAWDSVNAWGGLAIAGAVLTAAPVLGHVVGLTETRAWQVAACGAAALVLFWVLFVLPVVGSNVTLLATIGVAAGVIAAWIAPGRPDPAGGSGGSGGSGGQAW